MDAEGKLKSIESQIRAVRAGRTNVLNCPYCGAQNFDHEPPDPLCCETFILATAVVMDRIESEDLIEHASRVAEMAARN